MSSRLKRTPKRFGAVSEARLKSVGVAGSARSVRGSSSNKRGYGYRWQKERLIFLAENPLCVMCSTAENPVIATVIDHIRPHGGNQDLFWDRTNWQALCAHCHSSTKQRAEKRGRG